MQRRSLKENDDREIIIVDVKFSETLKGLLLAYGAFVWTQPLDFLETIYLNQSQFL